MIKDIRVTALTRVLLLPNMFILPNNRNVTTVHAFAIGYIDKQIGFTIGSRKILDELEKLFLTYDRGGQINMQSY